ncbi:MAG: hypothetical protein ACREP9_15290 [Candidatus Dormibacteraceae bacterium]
MNFDWQQFCSTYEIPFVTAGPNTAKGNISIHCPWCGHADPSEHLGLSLTPFTPYYNCWRNQNHRGRNPAFLVAILLQCSVERATAIVEAQEANPDAFEQTLSKLREPAPSQKAAERERSELGMPKDFRAFHWDGGLERNFIRYLLGRGFDGAAVRAMCRRYRLKWAVTGDYRMRVIIPVYVKDRLVTWTARAISDTASLRYRSLPVEASV